MYYETAFDFDDLPEDDEPDATLPPKEPEGVAASEEVGAAEDAEEAEVISDGELAEPRGASQASGLAVVAPQLARPTEDAHMIRGDFARKAEQTWAAPLSSSTVHVGQAEIAAAMASKHAEERFLMGPHGNYLDEDNGRLRMVGWTWARPWAFRPVGTAADPRYLISQRDLYLAAVDGGEQSLRLKTEPGRKGLWTLRPVPGDLSSRCYLVSSEGTFLASLDDKDQTLWMSSKADDWERWRCIRVKDSALAAPSASEPGDPASKPDGSAVVAFGLGDFDVSGLVCGSSPHLPVKAVAGVQVMPGQAGAKRLEEKDGQVSVEVKKEPALQWEGPRADFQIREEVLPMCMEREDTTVRDVLAIWEEWGCKFAGRLKFAAPPDFPVKWLPKSETVPGHPAVVRLEGPGAVLDEVTVALRRNGRKLAEAQA